MSPSQRRRYLLAAVSGVVLVLLWFQAMGTLNPPPETPPAATPVEPCVALGEVLIGLTELETLRTAGPTTVDPALLVAVGDVQTALSGVPASTAGAALATLEQIDALGRSGRAAPDVLSLTPARDELGGSWTRSCSPLTPISPVEALTPTAVVCADDAWGRTPVDCDTPHTVEVFAVDATGDAGAACLGALVRSGHTATGAATVADDRVVSVDPLPLVVFGTYRCSVTLADAVAGPVSPAPSAGGPP